ncbi:MAG: hypothetical protein ACRD3V_30190, partial [Vicinamibacteria bacterium]
MKRQGLPRILLLLMGAVAAGASRAQAHDELYYSAAQCHPFNGAHWEGGGSAGFAFTPAAGGWYNYDDNAKQALVCPVPYSRNVSNLEDIVARVVVDDRHGLSGVRAFLCGKNSTGPKTCDSADNFPTVFGVSTIELSIKPNAGMRWVWIEIEVPDDDDDNNPFSLNGTSGVIGYRVFRN